MMGSHADHLRVFDRRESLLQQVLEQPMDKCGLTEALEVSRSTVDRSIRELEGIGVVERGPEGYELTLRGRLMFEEYERFRRRIQSIDEATPVISGLPQDVAIDVAMLDGAEVVGGDLSMPFDPIERHLELLREADRIRVVGATVLPQYVETYHERIVGNGVRAEVALPGEMVERLLSSHREQFTEILDTGRLTLRELDERPPYSLAVLDGVEPRAGLLVYVADGIRGYLTNNSPMAVSWATQTFETYWENATPISP
jgi:predicted transcriptional regulator